MSGYIEFTSRRSKIVNGAAQFHRRIFRAQSGGFDLNSPILECDPCVQIESKWPVKPPGNGPNTPRRELAGIARTGWVVTQIRLQILSLKLERNSLFVVIRVAIVQHEMTDLQIQELLDHRLVRTGRFGCGQIGGAIRRNRYMNFGLVDRKLRDIHIFLERRNDFETDLNLIGANEW